jgi:cytochrome c peroxidase
LYFSSLPPGAVVTLPVPGETPLSCLTVELGRRLFFDPRLSRSGATSCATCHDSARAFTDGRTLSVGDGGAAGRRNSPTLLNRAYGTAHFFDGRVETLEAQALLPLTNPVELANTHEEIVRRLTADASYRREFERSFGKGAITIDRVASALATFQRTLIAGGSAFDRFAVHRDTAALTAEARRGLELIRGKARCIICHEPPFFTDERFHNTGVASRDGRYADSGRFVVTERPEDLGAFKTPTLRNIALTAPYMHDGSLSTLDEVVAFYDSGGRANAHLDPLVRPLSLDAREKKDLVAFLRSLTDSGRAESPAPGRSPGARQASRREACRK